MSLDLDERQRAMLQEMGVHVWLPAAQVPEPHKVQAAPAAAQEPREEVRKASMVAIENIAIEAINTRGTVQNHTETGLVDGIAGMDWPQLAQSVAACQACKLGVGRRAPVFGGATAPARADWLVLGEPPDEAEERAGTPFAEQAGQLLDNMLKALGVSRTAGGTDPRQSAYVSNVVKCRPAVVRNPEPAELAACENYLRREVALVQPKIILAMGRFAAQSLLRESLPDVAGIPLGKLRGQVYRYQGIPVVVSYHPAYLLRTQQDKARAWADLCLAQATIGS